MYRAALGERDQALAAIDQALTKANGDRDVFVRAGIAYSILGQHAKAAEWAHKAVEAGYTWPEINDAELDNARAQATRR